MREIPGSSAKPDPLPDLNDDSEKNNPLSPAV